MQLASKSREYPLAVSEQRNWKLSATTARKGIANNLNKAGKGFFLRKPPDKSPMWPIF